MTKLFKNSKQLISFVLAFAVLAMSLFTGTALTVSAASDTLYWDGSTYTEPTTQDSQGNYIIDTAAKLAYLACKTQSNHYETYGKTYKVADGIKAIVLQPESLAAIKDKTTAAEVKAFFDENAGAAKWWNVVGYNGQYPFQGTFDGNGATIYGIYANWASYADWHKDLYAGLFGLVDKGAVIKNVAVKNSYLTSKEGFIGPIFANSARNSTAWNATTNIGDGAVTVENCASINNYMNSPSENYNNKAKFGALTGGLTGDYLIMNNCIGYGNDATTNITTPDGVTFDMPLIAGLGGEAGTNSVTNVIALGATPYNRYDFGWGAYVNHKGNNTNTSCFENVYTDQPIGNFIMYSGSKAYNNFESRDMYGLVSITADGITGADAVDAMPELDWDTVWFANSGLPELRVFHDIEFVSDANGHGYKCNDCGINSISAHTYASADGETYICTDSACQYECLHTNLSVVDSDGDCVTAAGQYVSCTCGYYKFIPNGPAAPGHNLVHCPDTSDCLTASAQEHWRCSVCDKIFLTNDKWAAMNTAVAEEDLVVSLGGHTQRTDTNDGSVIIYNDKTGHWYECSVCDGRLDVNSGEMEEDEAIPHNYENGVCVDCGYKCVDHEYASTGKVLVAGDCTTDREVEVACKICGVKATEVTPAAHTIVAVNQVDPTDKMEGTKAHYKCSVCEAVFADAAGNTAITQAELIIPKTISEGYSISSSVTGSTGATTDNGTTSPATGDSAVMAVVVISALTSLTWFVRKVRKA